jgi:acetyl-CoA synthetase
VVLKSGGRGSDSVSSELRDYVKTKLLPYKYPRSIEYRDDLPKTGTGKIDRQMLKSDS